MLTGGTRTRGGRARGGVPRGGAGRGEKPRRRWRVVTGAVGAILVLLYCLPAPPWWGGGGAVATWGEAAAGGGIRAGASAVNITPYTRPGDPLSNQDADWEGGITATGIWGEQYEDLNGNGRYDPGEPFTDDPVNTRLDPGSRGKYDGIYLAGFGNDRLATGVYDPIWVRTLYLEGSGVSLAWAVLDVVGFSRAPEEEVRELLAREYPGVNPDVIMITSTHNHEGPDTMGMWGPDATTDGKYPRYMRYLVKKIAHGIAEAAARAVPVRVKYGQVTPAEYPDLEGLQCRNSYRTPWFFDDELRVMQLLDRETGRTVATLVNWSTHVESMGADNPRITSDFVHSLRETVEDAVGGVAVYVPGDQGAVEIVGDSGTRVWRRDTFDGQRFPVDAETGEPLTLTIERTYAIGRTVGKAVLRALEEGEFDSTATFLQVRARDLYVPVTNQALRLLAVLGVLDVPVYLSDRWRVHPLLGTSIKTAMYAIRIGEGTFTTVPGELFPEINFGLERHHRPDLARTGTGRPFEPCIRDQQPGKYRFLIGYTPDLLGYIVPGYDFYIYGLPGVSFVHLGVLMGEVPDPAADRPADGRTPGAVYGHHYHEINSCSSVLAAAVACTAVELWGGDPSAYDSYREWRWAKSALLRIPNPFYGFSWSFRHPWVRHF